MSDFSVGQEVRVVFDWEGRMVEWGTNRHGVVAASERGGVGASFVSVVFMDGRREDVDARMLVDDSGYRGGEYSGEGAWELLLDGEPFTVYGARLSRDDAWWHVCMWSGVSARNVVTGERMSFGGE